MRLFAGIPLSLKATERLLSLRLRLAEPGDGLRWSTPEQWHLTLRYFGDATDEQARQITTALAELAAEPAQVCISGLGLFPAKGILFAKVERTEGLLALQRRVERDVAATGVLPESRPFHPHVTLARSRNRKGWLHLQRMAEPELPAFGARLCWQAEAILLYRSELGSTGASYLPLAQQDLRLGDREPNS